MAAWVVADLPLGVGGGCAAPTHTPALHPISNSPWPSSKGSAHHTPYLSTVVLFDPGQKSWASRTPSASPSPRRWVEGEGEGLGGAALPAVAVARTTRLAMRQAVTLGSARGPPEPCCLKPMACTWCVGGTRPTRDPGVDGPKRFTRQPATLFFFLKSPNGLRYGTHYLPRYPWRVASCNL